MKPQLTQNSWKTWNLFYTLKSAIEVIHYQNWLNNSQTLIPVCSIHYKFYTVNNTSTDHSKYVYMRTVGTFYYKWQPLASSKTDFPLYHKHCT